MLRLSRPLPACAAGALVLFAASAALAQAPRAGAVSDRYAQLCASCHGANLQGAQAQSLLDNVWLNGGDDESLARSIRNGFPDKGMPAWSAALPEREIRAMVIYIREQRERHERGQLQFNKPADSVTAKTELHNYQLNTWVSGLTEPWSLAFLPDNKAVVTEKRGRLYLVENGKLASDPIRGVPEVDTGGQAGLFDVVPHPDYARNGWLYLAFADPQRTGTTNSSLTRIVRGKLRDGALVDQQTIYQAKLEHYMRAGGVHFGGRIAFDRQGYLYFTVGERNGRMVAQDVKVPIGKVHRLFDDGRIPEDNPFAKDPAAIGSIWSYGHRNPQGLAIHPVTNDVYDLEHGPRGGDELNYIRKGANYGWPVITYGMEYNGNAMTDITHKEGMEQPATYWVPSLAVCGMNFYSGNLFPKWKNHLFIAALASEQVRRIEVQGDKVVAQEVIFKDLGRVRHVIGGPDGALYALLPQRIVRITPAD